MRNIYTQNFDKLAKLGIINDKGELQFNESAKIENKPFMDLNLDLLREDKNKGIIEFSMAHNFIQNHDVMADPDMEIRIIPEMRSIEALTYQLDSMQIFQKVYPDENHVYPKIKKELNEFLGQWLNNLIQQGFKLNKEKLILCT